MSPTTKTAATKTAASKKTAAARKTASTKKPPAKPEGHAAREHCEQNLLLAKRLGDSIDRAQADLTKMRGDIGQGARDLRRDVAKLLRDARRDVHKMSVATRRDLERIQKDLATSASATAKKASASTSRKPASSTGSRG